MFTLSCRKKLLLLGVLIGIMVVVNSFLIFYVIQSNSQVNSRSYPSVALSDEMNLSIVQVQQFLSDISATRAQGGKDDGFKNAEENAVIFKAALKKYAEIRPDKAQFLKEYEAAFDAYYEQGKKMAQAYISNGPAAGNKLMPQFDEKAEQLAKYTEQMRQESEQEMTVNSAKVDSELKIVLAIIIVSGLVTVVLSFFVARSIAGALKIIMDSIKKDQDGYISIKEISLNSKDEFGQLAASLNVLLEQVRKFIKQVAASTEQLAAASEELTACAEQTAQVTNQVAESMVEVSRETEQEVDSVNKVAAIIERILVEIEQAATNSRIISGTSEKTAAAAQVGGKSVTTVINQMHTIEQAVASSASTVSKLGERSKEIGQIVDAISGIAGQTNLLALNAAIEAARAGEQGRGFAVVAEEVRQLAEQAQDAAKQIAGIVSEIQIDTEQAVTAMNDGTREVKLGAEVVNTAGRGFDEIISLVNEMAEQVKGITVAIQQTAGGGQQMASSIKSVEVASKDIAGQTQTVSAATEEQSASIEEIASSSRSLATMAQDLQVAINSFKL